jgi:hypothetical protein
VVVGRERCHAQVDGVGGPHLLERLAGQAFEDLLRGHLDIEPHRLHRGRVVVIAVEVPAHELDDRTDLLADRREDELVAPHGVPAEIGDGTTLPRTTRQALPPRESPLIVTMA